MHGGTDSYWSKVRGYGTKAKDILEWSGLSLSGPRAVGIHTSYLGKSVGDPQEIWTGLPLVHEHLKKGFWHYTLAICDLRNGSNGANWLVKCLDTFAGPQQAFFAWDGRTTESTLKILKKNLGPRNPTRKL